MKQSRINADKLTSAIFTTCIKLSMEHSTTCDSRTHLNYSLFDLFPLAMILTR